MTNDLSKLRQVSLGLCGYLAVSLLDTCVYVGISMLSTAQSEPFIKELWDFLLRILCRTYESTYQSYIFLHIRKYDRSIDQSHEAMEMANDGHLSSLFHLPQS